MDCSKPGFPVLHYLPDFSQIHVHWVGGAIQPSHPLFTPHSLALSLSCIRVFSNEPALHIRWPKYWSFSNSPSSEYSVLIYFRIDFFCDSMDCSPPGSPVHGILQARILEWVAIPFSRRSSPSRDRIQVSSNAGRRFTIWATGDMLLIKTPCNSFIMWRDFGSALLMYNWYAIRLANVKGIVQVLTNYTVIEPPPQSWYKTFLLP